MNNFIFYSKFNYFLIGVCGDMCIVIIVASFDWFSNRMGGNIFL